MERRHLTRETPRIHTAGSLENMLHKKLETLMDEALRAQKHRAHQPVGMQEPTHYIAEPAVRSTVACLKTGNLPALFDKDGRIRRTPSAAPAGVTVKLDAGLVAGSRVANAGAQVVVYPEATKAHAVGRTGTIATESVPAEFRNIEAAAFGTVDIEIEADAPAIALPILSAPIDWKSSAVKTLGVRFEIPRSERRRIDPEQLCAEIVTSLTLGLARAADEVLLSALTAETLTAFTLAKAATEGLVFDELRALVGTNAAGVVIGQDGVLRAAGIAAELTGDMAGTLVGAWNRAGVAVNEDVSIHFERLDTAGSLAVTAWASMLPLVPDANKFWTVA